MKSGDIVKEALKATGWSQQTLAKQLGYVDENGEGVQQAVGNRINVGRMRIDIFVKMLNTMGYELVVRSSNPNTNKNEWTVSE
jgi:ribosome-binding protein aMBF1 (putative translation factor)